MVHADQNWLDHDNFPIGVWVQQVQEHNFFQQLSYRLYHHPYNLEF